MRYSLTLCIGLLLALVACSEEGAENAVPEDFSIVPEGKADNYYSSVATEYEATGTVKVAMTPDEFADEALRKAMIQGRLTAVGLYLTTFVTDKFRGIDSNGDGQISESEVFFRNDSYGGFHAMVRNYSAETENVVPDANGAYDVTFTIDVAGPQGLLQAIPGEWDASANGLRFSFQMPEGSAITGSSIPRQDIRRFDPKTFTGTLESITVVAAALPEVQNAYPQYAAFMADGLFDITLFFGHDYNTARSDLREAREAFEELASLDFALPVARFEDLESDSGPATRTLLAGGKEVKVEVRIFHSDMFTTNRKGQHDLALSEVAARDVFFYNGHAGPYYGFYLDSAGMAQVNYSEFSTLNMVEDRQQFIVAQGCQTYSQYADMLYANPAKSEANLDVITTVNYSYGRGTLTILRNLLATDSQERHTAVDFYTIVRDLNNDWLNDSRDVFYGVMGIDGNPQLHPYANLAKLGAACTEAKDCGEPSGNLCIADGTKKVCAVKTLGANACPSGSTYRQLASGSTIKNAACFKDTSSAPVTTVFGIASDSVTAGKILDLVNTNSAQDLDEIVGLNARSAKNIVDYRNGLDGLESTPDDNRFDTLEELDAVSYVGKATFGLLEAFVK